jgi:hypothetical protein
LGQTRKDGSHRSIIVCFGAILNHNVFTEGFAQFFNRFRLNVSVNLRTNRTFPVPLGP